MASSAALPTQPPPFWNQQTIHTFWLFWNFAQSELKKKKWVLISAWVLSICKALPSGGLPGLRGPRTAQRRGEWSSRKPFTKEHPCSSELLGDSISQRLPESTGEGMSQWSLWVLPARKAPLDGGDRSPWSAARMTRRRLLALHLPLALGSPLMLIGAVWGAWGPLSCNHSQI